MLLADEIRRAKRVYLIGNGGSAANAIHIANDLVSVGVRAHPLAADIATVTAIANDFGYEKIFCRQVSVFGEAGDLLIALSGSGRSLNICEALKTGKKIGMRTVAIFGNFSDIDEGCADIVMRDGHSMQEAEEIQIEIGHELMRNLRA